MTPISDNHDVWRSLFLPLEDVIFTSFITLVSPCRLANASDDKNCKEHCSSASEAAAGAAAGAAAATVERSPLFALCGERADTMVCVLANRDVCFVDMTDEHAGPAEVRRLHGTKCLRGNGGSTATCAALIPLEVGHACRLPVAAVPLSPASRAGHRPAGAKTLFLRGVVGSSDGRVDVFSEHGYVFGFVAHDSPVTAVSAIYGVGDDAASAPDHTHTAQPDAPRSFESATASLGFITCGTDGVVLVWRRENLTLRPRVIARSSFFSRAVAWCAVQPSSRDWLLSGMGAPRSSLFIHTVPYSSCELRMRGVAALDDVGPRVPLPGASLFSRTTAIASNGEIALIARGRKVYRVALAEARCDFVLETPSPVALMQLARGGIAVAVAGAACAKSKADVFVLDARRGALLGTYATGLPGPARCIALHSGARLCAVVSARGAVKVAVIPDAYAEHIEADEEVAEAIPAARVLQCLAKMQRETPDGRASVEEALVMSRMSVPGEVNNYLHRTAGVW